MLETHMNRDYLLNYRLCDTKCLKLCKSELSGEHLSTGLEVVLDKTGLDLVERCPETIFGRLWSAGYCICNTPVTPQLYNSH